MLLICLLKRAVVKPWREGREVSVVLISSFLVLP